MPAKRKQHYVDNKLFLAKIIEYRQSIEEARLLDKPKPRIPHYLGECFLKIATHLSYRPNFINYMFKEDMVSDGVETVCNISITLTQQNPKTPLLILHK